MININGKLLDELNESEYYLFSILLNYGKKSRPKNDVLMSKTGWGEQKLKKVKRSLKEKGLLVVNPRFGGKKGRGRNSNEYVINTKLASKFNGKKEDVQRVDFNTVEIKLDDFNTVEVHPDDFKWGENQGGYKVLKLVIIESIKLLKEKESIETPPPFVDESFKFLAEFQKIKNGELTRKTNLDKNFHFGLFEDSWTNEFKNAILEMWRYLESNENKPVYWGKLGTLTSQLSVIRSSLNQYSEQEIIKAFDKCRFASTKSWPMYLEKTQEPKPDISNYTPPYDIPDFGGCKEKRNDWFFYRLTEYHFAELLDEGLWNTVYKPRAKYKKDAEAQCYEIEQEFPEVLKVEIP